MTLPSGVRIGSLEIVAPLGAGGMGEVYRARDTKLCRDVAIKVLPQAFAADADRLARFQREAQLLASLNHPHIAAIYGLEDSNGAPAMSLPRSRESARSSAGPGSPAQLFMTHIGPAVSAVVFSLQYVVGPDGRRFLMQTVIDAPSAAPITLVLNWRLRQ